MGTCPECLHDSQTGSGLATMSASSSLLMDASCQVSRASLISVNVPELLPLPLGSLYCSGLPYNLRSLAFLNASLCGRGWGNVLLTLPFVTRPLATFGSLVSGSCRSYPILERCYFCVKKRLWVFFLLLIFSFASFSGSNEWISGIRSGRWFLHLLVHQELSGTLHPEYLWAAEQRTRVVSWCFWLLFHTLTQFPFCSSLTQASLLSSKSGNCLDAVFINKVY